jgi:hypothetical protein
MFKHIIFTHSVGILVITFAGASLVSAQPASSPSPPDRKTAVAFTGGLSAGSSDAGAAIGATVSRDLTDRLAIEGSGAYLDRGPGADAIAVNASLIVNLTPHAEKSVPYVAAGLGIYRASFDLGHSRFFGAPGSSFGPGYGAGVCAPGAGHGMGPGFGGLNGPCQYGQFPGFYRHRLGPLDVTPGREWGSRHFTDPAFTLGGGLRLNLTPRLALRPDVRALIVMRDGDTYTVGVFTMNIGYQF